MTRRSRRPVISRLSAWMIDSTTVSLGSRRIAKCPPRKTAALYRACLNPIRVPGRGTHRDRHTVVRVFLERTYRDIHLVGREVVAMDVHPVVVDVGQPDRGAGRELAPSNSLQSLFSWPCCRLSFGSTRVSSRRRCHWPATARRELHLVLSVANVAGGLEQPVGDDAGQSMGIQSSRSRGTCGVRRAGRRSGTDSVGLW